MIQFSITKRLATAVLICASFASAQAHEIQDRKYLACTDKVTLKHVEIELPSDQNEGQITESQLLSATKPTVLAIESIQQEIPRGGRSEITVYHLNTAHGSYVLETPSIPPSLGWPLDSFVTLPDGQHLACRFLVDRQTR